MMKIFSLMAFGFLLPIFGHQTALADFRCGVPAFIGSDSKAIPQPAASGCLNTKEPTGKPYYDAQGRLARIESLDGKKCARFDFAERWVRLLENEFKFTLPKPNKHNQTEAWAPRLAADYDVKTSRIQNVFTYEKTKNNKTTGMIGGVQTAYAIPLEADLGKITDENGVTHYEGPAEYVSASDRKDAGVKKLDFKLPLYLSSAPCYEFEGYSYALKIPPPKASVEPEGDGGRRVCLPEGGCITVYDSEEEDAELDNLE